MLLSKKLKVNSPVIFFMKLWVFEFATFRAMPFFGYILESFDAKRSFDLKKNNFGNCKLQYSIVCLYCFQYSYKSSTLI